MVVCMCVARAQDQYSRKECKVLLKETVHCAKEAVKKETGKAGHRVYEWQELLSKMTKSTANCAKDLGQ